MKAARLGIVLMILANAVMFVGKLIIPELDLMDGQDKQLHSAFEALSAFLGAIALFVNPDASSAQKAWIPKGILGRIFGK